MLLKQSLSRGGWVVISLMLAGPARASKQAQIVDARKILTLEAYKVRLLKQHYDRLPQRPGEWANKDLTAKQRAYYGALERLFRITHGLLGDEDGHPISKITAEAKRGRRLLEQTTVTEAHYADVFETLGAYHGSFDLAGRTERYLGMPPADVDLARARGLLSLMEQDLRRMSDSDWSSWGEDFLTRRFKHELALHLGQPAEQIARITPTLQFLTEQITRKQNPDISHLVKELALSAGISFGDREKFEAEFGRLFRHHMVIEEQTPADAYRLLLNNYSVWAELHDKPSVAASIEREELADRLAGLGEAIEQLPTHDGIKRYKLSEAWDPRPASIDALRLSARNLINLANGLVDSLGERGWTTEPKVASLRGRIRPFVASGSEDKHLPPLLLKDALLAKLYLTETGDPDWPALAAESELYRDSEISDLELGLRMDSDVRHFAAILWTIAHQFDSNSSRALQSPLANMRWMDQPGQ